MDRETTTIVLPKSGAKVVMHTYLLSGEQRQVRKLAADAMRMSVKEGEAAAVEDMSGGFALEMEDMTLQFLIKSVTLADGTEVSDIKDFVYNLHQIDGDFLYSEANRLSDQSEMDKETKKK